MDLVFEYNGVLVPCIYYSVPSGVPGHNIRKVAAFKQCKHFCAHASVNSRTKCCLCSTNKGPHWRKGPCFVCEGRERQPKERAGLGAGH